MTTTETRSRSAPPSPLDLRLSVIGRRTSLSGPLAIILADLAFGTRQRDDAETLHCTTGARVADTMGAPS